MHNPKSKPKYHFIVYNTKNKLIFKTYDYNKV